jgi:hypothetical protein
MHSKARVIDINVKYKQDWVSQSNKGGVFAFRIVISATISVGI